MAMVWLSRIFSLQGYGVQSPWAFGFVRSVISDKSYCPAYEMMMRDYPGTRKPTRKVCRLCMRMAVHEKPKTMAFVGDLPPEYKAYSVMGRREAKVITLGEGGSGEPVDFAVIAPGAGVEGRFDEVCRHAHDTTFAMLPNIYTDSEARSLWRGKIAEMEGVVTFDLYYCGLAYFDKKRYRENHIINF